MPGLLDLLGMIEQRKLPKAVCTSSERAYLEKMLARFKLTSRFQATLTAEDVAHGKPHPEPYRTGARLLGAAPEDCVAIEDSPTGVRSAVSAGVPTIAVPHVVAVPAMPGAVHLDSLVGLTPRRLGELAREARAARPSSVVGGNRGT